MSIKGPGRRWFYVPDYILLAFQALSWTRFKNLLPNIKVIVNGKRLFGLAVGKNSRSRERIYMFPMDDLHMYCPHCDGSIPTHDVLAALRPAPQGNSRLFLVELVNGGDVGLINERDYNPIFMRMHDANKPFNGTRLECWSSWQPFECPGCGYKEPGPEFDPIPSLT